MTDNFREEIDRLKKEREDFFLWDNQHPIEQVQHMTLAQYASGSLVRAWQYNEIVDKLADAKAEIAAVHVAMDEAGIPRGHGPLDAPMTLLERVQIVLAMPQRKKYENEIARLKEKSDFGERCIETK